MEYNAINKSKAITIIHWEKGDKKVDLDKMDRRQHFKFQQENSNEYPKITFETEQKPISLEDEKDVEPPHDEAEYARSKLEEKDSVSDRESDLERIEPDNITIEKEKFDEETLKNAGGMNTVKYRTKDVANILDVTEQTVRNNASFFEDYLDIEKKSSGHRRYTKQAIDKLRLIFQLKNEKNFTNEQVIEYLQGDSKDFTALSPDQKLDMVLMMITKTISEVMEQTANNLTETNQKMLEQQNDLYNENLKENTELIRQLTEKLTEKDDYISSLREDKDELARQNEEFRRQLLEIQQQASFNQNHIIEELEKLKKDEQPQKKGWRFWK